MIIGIIVFVAIFIYYIVRSIIEQDGFVIFGGLMFGTLGFLIVLVITVFTSLLVPEKDIIWEVTSSPIVALQDNAQTNSSFFLGSGTSKNHLYYYYMEQIDDGYKLRKMPAEDILIKYDDNPHIERHNVVGYAHWYNYVISFFPERDPYSIIYVPEGAILTNFNIDLR